MSSVCVHGLGYIGLPTAAMLANYGHTVIGYDVDEELVNDLQAGQITFDEPGLQAFVTEALESGNLEVSDEVGPAKYHIIAVPTPFDEEAKVADISYIEAAGEAITPHLRPGDSVILESTVPPGTTVNTLQPVLEESGLAAGNDFALIHCPETVLPGNIITELRENDRIIGGVNGVSTEAAVRLYESFVEGDIHTTANATTAEFVKLIQNTYRDTNIALANELAQLARDYDIDSREAIHLANQHPRVEIHQPGPGVGGHCLPIDPWFLGQNSDNLDLISTAREINDGMVDYIVDLVGSTLGTLAGKQIAILGVAYKGNVDDIRNSPGLEIARQLQSLPSDTATPISADGGQEAGIQIKLHDPHVQDQTLDLDSLADATDDADAVIIATDHEEYTEIDPPKLKSRMGSKLVVDTKAILEQSTWEDAGFTVIRI
ncbi:MULTISPECIES: nucleotide sugar dehydrogenase [Halomicrobium]|uniref:UDP-N-acetyl-D-mannosamine dehydrogenase n=2 Tax=Halomicrobium mukohataei TaxID=57705 RepID=C7NW84_HALMD|nr:MULTISPECIES: nucleotide sugar dehydrogenase [Halomicrobium]ACV46225.1 nucleotide sugar dehydrogenase [Halomicrobium mukohataei DSM 12286]QCD64788.1 nucleotide sugar dehydrogenase [Halomicrobium mukohataei]QFR19595.1 nucleotide sugar dehydrogenase [Halomicrobium sp. ZPS1]